MPRLVQNKLTVRRVETERRPGFYADGNGLYLRVVGGSKGWIFRYSFAGTRHDLGLGPVREVPLAEARELVAAARKQIRHGIDPFAIRHQDALRARAAAAKTMTFKGAAERYMDAHRTSWKNPKHRRQWENSLAAYTYPVMGGLSMAAIETATVMQVVEPIWTTKPETASRLRGRIEAVLDWAAAREYRAGTNPARWRGHLENLLPKKTKVRPVEHHAALPYAELPDFVAALRKQEGIAARALEFAILTAARTGEALGMRWGEIDPDRRLWVIPAERMKAGKEHRVPLCDWAIAILDDMSTIRTGELVFPGRRIGKTLASMAFPRVLRRMERGGLTAHGFRSTFSDWCTEQTDFPSEAREMALAHAVGSKVEQAYRRGDLFEKRRQLMTAWETFIGGRRDRLTDAGRDAPNPQTI